MAGSLGSTDTGEHPAKPLIMSGARTKAILESIEYLDTLSASDAPGPTHSLSQSAGSPEDRIPHEHPVRGIAVRFARVARLDADDSRCGMNPDPRNRGVAAAVRGLQQRRDFRRLPHALERFFPGERERFGVPEDRVLPHGTHVHARGRSDRGPLHTGAIVQHKKAAGHFLIPPLPVLVVA